ncbi:MAG TPA: hypothetical protein VEA69_24670 [Tepidisphaeraceae bacterium]|nr:hypothetical protein [Tepidisphaeraceae bacterium]
MTSLIRTWKCVPCDRTYRSKATGLAGADSAPRHCPACGAPMALASEDLDRPTPKPKAVAASAPAKPSRPADPAAALSAFSPSAPWTPAADPGPSTGLSHRAAGAARRLAGLDALAEQVPLSAAALTSLANKAYASKRTAPARRPPLTIAAAAAALLAVVAFTVVLAGKRGDAPPQPAAAAATTPTSIPAVPTSIDLLATADFATACPAGAWSRTGAELRSNDAKRAILPLAPATLPDQYDFTVEFTRTGGDSCVVQMFTVNKHPCSLVLGGWSGTVSGFQHIGGKTAQQNPTAYTRLDWRPNVRYTATVKVRRGRIEAWVDGKRIAAHFTTGADLSNKDRPTGASPLGIGSETSPTTFHKVTLTPITE